jgi:hypothetical protein
MPGVYRPWGGADSHVVTVSDNEPVGEAEKRVPDSRIPAW